jgi:hypothetical protein
MSNYAYRDPARSPRLSSVVWETMRQDGATGVDGERVDHAGHDAPRADGKARVRRHRSEQ